MSFAIPTMESQWRDVQPLVYRSDLPEILYSPLKQDSDLIVLYSDEDDIQSAALYKAFVMPEIHDIFTPYVFVSGLNVSNSDYQDIFAGIHESAMQLAVDLVEHF